MDAKRLAQRQAAISLLEHYSGRIEKLMKLVEDGLFGQKKVEACQRLKDLKGDLKIESHVLHKRRNELNDFERWFIEPAIRQASANIMSRVNSTPDGKWHSNLYGVRIDINHPLFELRKLPDDWTPG